MPTVKLTERGLASLQPGSNRDPRITFWDTALPGFGVIVGPRGKVFVARRWVGGRKRKVTIGKHGAPREDGTPWTVLLARKRAAELLGQMAAGTDPGPAARRSRRGGPTLRDGLKLHVENMRKKRRSPRSIQALEAEIPKYLADWLDKPIAELTGAELDAVCKRLMADTKPRAGSVNPPGAALTKRLVAQVSAIWNALDRLHELPGRNPAKRITTHALAPKEDRIADADLPGWYARVMGLRPVRRDLNLMALFTGLRSESLRTLRWEDVDHERRVLHVRKAKGDRPYTVPLCKTHLDILEARQRENALEFDWLGGDHGWIFPSFTRAKPYKVIPVAEAKERRKNKDTGEMEKYLPGMHPLRKTFNSVAIEIGVSKEHREALMNHEGQGVNVKHYGFPQNWDHLAECQAKIEAALWARLKPEPDEPKPKRQAKSKTKKGARRGR